ENDHFDAILHTAGVFASQDIRTADRLNLYFAVNYLSRYHLTQLLLPALRRAERGRVVMMTAKVDLSTKADLRLFPRFEPFDFGRMNDQIAIGNHHYAAYLARSEPGLLTGVPNRRCSLYLPGGGQGTSSAPTSQTLYRTSPHHWHQSPNTGF